MLLVAVLAEALLAAGRPADAACRVRLDIDPAASTLVLTSNNALRPRQPPFSDIPSPSSFARNVSRGFSGSLYASNAALAACPAADDAAAWLAAWPAFNLSSEAQPTLYQAISVYPRLNLGRTAVARPGTYDYNVSAIEVRLLATGPAATPAATPGPGGRQLQLEVPLRTLLLSGYLSTSNAITGSRYDSIANLTSNSTVPATLRWRRRWVRPPIPEHVHVRVWNGKAGRGRTAGVCDAAGASGARGWG